MNLLGQELASRQNYYIKHPGTYDFCVCGFPKKKSASKCKECRFLRPIIYQPDDPFIQHIALTRGQIAVVDTFLYEWLNRYRWLAQWNRHTRSFYATTTISGNKSISMHRMILGLKTGDPRKGDHEASGETLDNRGCNLRTSSREENAQNRRRNRNNSTGYKGVYPIGKVFGAKILVNKVKMYLGTRSTAKEAHEELYAPAALKHHGKFARLD